MCRKIWNTLELINYYNIDKDKATRSQSSNSEVKSESGEDTAKTSKHLNYSEEARKDEEKSPPLLERKTPQNFELPKNFTDLTNVQVSFVFFSR